MAELGQTKVDYYQTDDARAIPHGGWSCFRPKQRFWGMHKQGNIWSKTVPGEFTRGVHHVVEGVVVGKSVQTYIYLESSRNSLKN